MAEPTLSGADKTTGSDNPFNLLATELGHQLVRDSCTLKGPDWDRCSNDLQTLASPLSCEFRLIGWSRSIFNRDGEVSVEKGIREVELGHEVRPRVFHISTQIVEILELSSLELV
ncbi:MAG TPA: hypothetical protein VGJ80_13655 [Gemmatimonadales bacterium]